jgi:hypothetical protein
VGKIWEMSRNVLLVEPNHKNKYPPIGLMKLSTYHKMIGDKVVFFKGELSELVLEDIYQALLKQLYLNDDKIFWEKYKLQLCEYIKNGDDYLLAEIPIVSENLIVRGLFNYYRHYFKSKEYFKPENRKWDRVCVSTLFTFYWNITVNTINFVKRLCKYETEVKVGGIIATVLNNELKEKTGIKPMSGLLDKPGMLDDNSIIIDTLPLDYSILEEIDYEYPAANSYFAYTTRGCTNRCKFCAVPKLEPRYKSYISISRQKNGTDKQLKRSGSLKNSALLANIENTDKRFGLKKTLLLLDNNVLASSKFEKIVEEIKMAGFARDNKFNPPNLFEIAIDNLRKGYNERGYIRSIVRQYHNLLNYCDSNERQDVYNLLKANFLLDSYTAKKESIFATYEYFKDLFEKLYRKTSLMRYVDFNQGIDARLVNDENMEKLFEISIRPLRIAFDSWGESTRKAYEKAVRTAVKHGHKNLSSYILYNYEKDKPIELYERLKLNVELSEELGVSIYSFPMKYHPISGAEFFDNRDYVGTYWKKKFIRTVQAVLNSTKGKIGRGKSFFYEAFGSNESEFNKLLYMPETMIIYRMFFKNSGITDIWWNSFNELNPQQKKVIEPIIHSNNFNNVESLTCDGEILNVLSYYKIKRADVEKRLQKKV